MERPENSGAYPCRPTLYECGVHVCTVGGRHIACVVEPRSPGTGNGTRLRISIGRHCMFPAFRLLILTPYMLIIRNSVASSLSSGAHPCQPTLCEFGIQASPTGWQHAECIVHPGLPGTLRGIRLRISDGQHCMTLSHRLHIRGRATHCKHQEFSGAPKQFGCASVSAKIM